MKMAMWHKLVLQLVNDLRWAMDRACPHSLNFKPAGKLTKAEITKLQKALNESFRTWAKTWIYPGLDALEAEAKRTKESVEASKEN